MCSVLDGQNIGMLCYVMHCYVMLCVMLCLFYGFVAKPAQGSFISKPVQGCYIVGNCLLSFMITSPVILGFDLE